MAMFFTKTHTAEDAPTLHVVGHAMPLTQHAPAPVEPATPLSFSLEPLVQAQQREIAKLLDLVVTMRDEITLVTHTLQQAQLQAHERERDLVRVLHRYILTEQG